MKGSEKKGFFGRLFGGKEEGREAVKPSEPDKKKSGKSPDAEKTKPVKVEEPERREDATEQARTQGTAKPPATSDAVELEMDIPEEEFATVAISASDLILEADLKEEPPPADGPQALHDQDDDQPDVTSQVVARRYGFPEYTDETADLSPKKESEEYVIRETMEIEETAPQVAGLRETIRIDRRETEEAADEEKAPEAKPVTEAATEPVVTHEEEVVAEEPETPVHPVGIRDVARSRDESPADAFGLEKQARVLARFIETCQTPFTVAIHGEEGGGKTSFMNLTASILDDSRVIPLWFNARDHSRLGLGDRLSILFLRYFINELEKYGGNNGGQSNQRVLDTIRLLGAATAAGLERAPRVSDDEKVNEARACGSLGELAESAPLVKLALQEVVSRALDATSKSRVVVFMDDLDRQEPDKALELLDCLSAFLQLNGTVFVAACNLDTVTRGAVKSRAMEREINPASLFRKVFQLSLDVRGMEFDRRRYVAELLNQAGLVVNEKSLSKFLALLETSVGFNPRGTKGIVNDFVYLKTLRSAKASTAEESDEVRAGSDLVRFGILCLLRSFDGAFRYLLANAGDGSAFSNLLEDILRSERQVLEVDSAHSLFDGSAPKQASAARLVRFVDVLLDCLDTGSRSKKLSREERDLIKEAIEQAVLVNPAVIPPRPRDGGREAIGEFCRRVKSRIARVSPDLAPDASSGDLRNWPSPAPWYALWYGDGQVKKAWDCGYVFFELTFKGDEWNTVAVSLKCDTAKAVEMGVDKKAIEDLKVLPILEEADFELQDGGNGWMQITKELRISGLGAGREISEDDLENVVEELRDLVEAAHGLFDVIVPEKAGHKPREQGRSSTGPTCKTCGTPLEKVRLKDGSMSYRCDGCGKIYKVKGATSPAG